MQQLTILPGTRGVLWFRMRSIAELGFRVRQEAANFLLFAAPPTFAGDAPLRLHLPDPQTIANALAGSEYARCVESTASRLLAQQFPLLGVNIETGHDIRWRRDYLHGAESGTQYFRRIPYLNFSAVGDHKLVWELNRHQHLVLLAQAFLFTRRAEFKHEIFRQLESWFEQNPFQRGINWASALEVGFRALSWTWLYHFVGDKMPPEFRRKFLTELYHHGRYLAENLSIYFSPNTHLLGEAVALQTLGTLFETFPESRAWRERGLKIVEQQLQVQVQADGSHFEQSTYYHVYALDFFIFSYLLAGRPQSFVPVLSRMAEYLAWLLGPAGRIAFFGDDDGGRMFHPYGERDKFGRATLATCGILLGHEQWIGTHCDIAQQAAWWVGAHTLESAKEQRSIVSGNRLFKQCGAAFLESGNLRVQMDVGSFGYGGAGHSHSDTLSLVLSLGGEWVFIDPGTYTYIASPEERAWFRGSAAHNTIRIDDLDQAQPAGPFRWSDKPEVCLNGWRPGTQGGLIDATCQYRGFSHRRRVSLEPGRLLVLDEIDGPPGVHRCEQTWHLGPAVSNEKLSFSAPVAQRASDFSPAYGIKLPGTALIARLEGAFPLRIAMLFDVDQAGAITIEQACRAFMYEPAVLCEAKSGGRG